MAKISRYSLYRHSLEMTDPRGNLITTEYEPYRYRYLRDNITHVVVEGETLMQIAFLYWGTLPDPGSLYRVIADFQPEPIVDPFLKLAGGSKIIVPSENTLLTKILDPDRRRYT